MPPFPIILHISNLLPAHGGSGGIHARGVEEEEDVLTQCVSDCCRAGLAAGAHGVMASIAACRSEGPGSIPGVPSYFAHLLPAHSGADSRIGPTRGVEGGEDVLTQGVRVLSSRARSKGAWCNG